MKYADIILFGDNIFTGLADVPAPGAVAIADGKIAKVFGAGEDFSAMKNSETNIIDCTGQLVMPGFIDAHIHFFMGATAASGRMCMDITASKSEAECVEIIKAFADAHPDYERILGMGWFPAFWNDAPLPTKASLDAFFPDKPVYLACADGHTIWTNTKGLEECGIDENTKVAFGSIPLGEDGKPNGLLIELDAMATAQMKQMTFPREIAEEMYRIFLAEIAANGITSICDMNPSILGDDTYALYDTLLAMDKAGKLTARMHLFSDLITISEGAETEQAAAEKYRGTMLRYNGLKQFIDGVTSTYTGFLLEPYSDNPATCGEANYPKEEYARCVKIANAAGFPVRFHAIGDAAVRWALDVFEAANESRDDHGNISEIRNTIEHIETIDEADIPRFSELGVVASPQPYHLTLDANEKISRCGEARCRWEWPLRSFLDTGARMAFSTDFPVVGFNPFKNIYAAISRCDDEGKPTGVNPEEKISLTEALKIYTAGSAYAFGREKELGTLEEGKLADIAVVDRNLFDIPEFEINECGIALTICNGEVVYSR